MTDQETCWKKWIRLGALAAFLQLVCIILMGVLPALIGGKPETVTEYFIVMQANGFIGVLRDESPVMIIMFLYIFTFYGIYAATKKENAAFSAFAMILTFIAVVCYFSSHTGFSMLYLSDQYADAVTEAEKNQILAAGRAVIAQNGWNSTGGYMAGLLLQGSGIMISVMMLKSDYFSKLTGISGLLANGLDLLQHIVHPFHIAMPLAVLMAAGSIYLIWFPALGWDLLKIGRKSN